MKFKKRIVKSLATALVVVALAVCSVFSVSASGEVEPSTATAGGSTSTAPVEPVKTGETDLSATIAIFSIMAAVSLGTAVVATKAKKNSSK